MTPAEKLALLQTLNAMAQTISETAYLCTMLADAKDGRIQAIMQHLKSTDTSLETLNKLLAE